MESKIEQFPEKIGFTKIVKDKLREYSVLSIIAIIILVLVIYAYIRFKGDADKTMWGQYGDFVGGFIGTIVALLSVYYLVATLREQQRANVIVSSNNKEIAEVYLAQQFDNNYQHLIRLYQDAVNSYSVENIRSREALKKLYENLYAISLDTECCYADRKDVALLVFDKEFYIPNRVSSAVHFRVLYQIFNLIENSGLDEQRYKVKYAKLVRSQIDEDELLLLRYNCWSRYGEKMRIYVNQYNLLKHLPILSLLEFRYWHNEVVKDEIQQNALDTELICQKKLISSFFSDYSDNNTTLESDVSEKYKLIISRAPDNKLFAYTLRRCDNQIDKYPVDNALTALGDTHTLNFLTDFLHELLEYSNFCIYNKNLDYDGIVKVNKDRKITDFTITVKANVSIVLKYKKYLNRSPEQMSGPTPILK